MTARGLGHALAIPLLGAGLALGSSAGHLLPAASPCAAASYSSHVTLVVEHGDGQVVGLCIGFDGATISGKEILQASGLEYATAGYGALGDAVCQIDDEPAAYTACLPSSGSYWVIFVARDGGGWQVAGSGISTETFASGDAEGFRYDPQDGADPPPASPAGICAAALAGPSSSASATTGGGAAGASGGSASGSAAGGQPGSAAAAPPPSATVTPTTTGTAAAAASAPPPGVIAPAGQPQGAAASAAPAAAEAGISLAPLVAAVVVGALAGLLVVQLVVRRRRI
ncbi:MAG: hypothetical protein ACLQGJ_00995 [Candidatus Dormibacteria bacterium]